MRRGWFLISERWTLFKTCIENYCTTSNNVTRLFSRQAAFPNVQSSVVRFSRLGCYPNQTKRPPNPHTPPPLSHALSRPQSFHLDRLVRQCYFQYSRTLQWCRSAQKFHVNMLVISDRVGLRMLCITKSSIGLLYALCSIIGCQHCDPVEDGTCAQLCACTVMTAQL